MVLVVVVGPNSLHQFGQGPLSSELTCTPLVQVFQWARCPGWALPILQHRDRQEDDQLNGVHVMHNHYSYVFLFSTSVVTMLTPACGTAAACWACPPRWQPSIGPRSAAAAASPASPQAGTCGSVSAAAWLSTSSEPV